MEQRFGDYTLFDSETQRNKDNRKLLHVICKCGSIDFKQERYLFNGKTSSCKSCSSKKTAKNYPPPVKRTGYGELSGTHFLSIKHGAAVRNIEFKITPEYLWKLYVLQNGKCALTGVDIVLNRSLNKQNVNWSAITASIDRKDSTIGYVENNLWWVHKEVNRLKNNYSMDRLLYWAKLLVNKHGNPDPSVLNDNLVSTKEQRLDGEKSINNPSTSAQPCYAGEDIV